MFGVEPLFFGVERLFFGVERANFAGDPEDQHSHPGMVAVKGKYFCCPVLLGLAKKVGQKKDRNGQKRIHPHALHGHVKKPSNREANISLEDCNTYCCI